MDRELFQGAVAHLLGGAGAMALPLVLFFALRRRYRLPGRVFLVGAGTFFVFQGILRLPWQNAFTQWSQPRWGVLVTLLVASFTAALFEETGRYVAYRWMVRRPSGADAVAMGLGHGGFESAVLVGLSLVGVAIAVLLTGTGALSLPPEAAEALAQAADAVRRGGWAAPGLALVERVAALGLHVGLSILVAAAWAFGRARWWLLAVAVHFGVNAVATSLAASGQAVMAEALVLAAAAVFLRVVARWLPELDRRAATAAMMAPTPVSTQVPEGDHLAGRPGTPVPAANPAGEDDQAARGRRP